MVWNFMQMYVMQCPPPFLTLLYLCGKVCEWNIQLLLETNIIVDLQIPYCLIMWIIFNIATPSVVGGNTDGTYCLSLCLSVDHNFYIYV
jgi:hypothetical protein